MSMKKKNLIFNSIMAFAVLIIVFAAIMLIGNTRGWFSDEGRMSSGGVLGNVTITRGGIAYTLENGAKLQDGDEIETGSGDSAAIVIDGDKNIKLNEQTSVKLKAGAKEIEIVLNSGEIFCAFSGSDDFKITSGSRTLQAQGAVFSISDASDVITVNVFDGSVKLSAGSYSQAVQMGEYGLILTNEADKDELKVGLLAPASLDKFVIDSAIAANANRPLCFTAQDLQNILTAREQEAAKAKAEADAALAALLAQGGNQAVTTSKTVKTGDDGQPMPVYTCTISIRCDTILNNMGDLTAGKDKYVPANGVILGSSTLQFYEGETVFDVLKRAVDATGIQMEYSFSPLYGSYYIEGINNLYEFDCGDESGWMYKVNGWFPNYGCSSYKLKAGDVIVWCYTCKELGADVGGGM